MSSIWPKRGWVYMLYICIQIYIGMFCKNYKIALCDDYSLNHLNISAKVTPASAWVHCWVFVLCRPYTSWSSYLQSLWIQTFYMYVLIYIYLYRLIHAKEVLSLSFVGRCAEVGGGELSQGHWAMLPTCSHSMTICKPANRASGILLDWKIKVLSLYD